MSKAEYARHAGVSGAAVTWWIKNEKIPVRQDGTIDAVAADFARGATRERATVREEPSLDVPPLQPRTSRSFDSASFALAEARTKEARVDAGIKTLKLKTEMGRLVDKDDLLQSAEVVLGRLVRDLEQLPGQTDRVIAAFYSRGTAGARNEMRTIVEEIRRTMAEGMRTLQKLGDDKARAAAAASPAEAA